MNYATYNGSGTSCQEAENFCIAYLSGTAFHFCGPQHPRKLKTSTQCCLDVGLVYRAVPIYDSLSSVSRDVSYIAYPAYIAYPKLVQLRRRWHSKKMTLVSRVVCVPTLANMRCRLIYSADLLLGRHRRCSPSIKPASAIIIADYR